MEITKSGESVTFRLDSELELNSKIWLGFIEDVKRMIPASNRSYNKATQEWTVHITTWPVIVQLRKKYFIGENQLDLLEDTGQ